MYVPKSRAYLFELRLKIRQRPTTMVGPIRRFFHDETFHPNNVRHWSLHMYSEQRFASITATNLLQMLIRTRL